MADNESATQSPRLDFSPEGGSSPVIDDPKSPELTRTTTGASAAGLGIQSTPTQSTVASSSYLLEDPKLREIMLSDVSDSLCK